MKSLVSFFTLLFIKAMSNIFYRFDIGWPRENKIRWSDVKLIVFLNHTSLFEILYLGFLPVSFLRALSKHMVAPGADKTLKRPIVGFFFRLFSPGMTPITRKRDNSWQQFLESMHPDCIIVIAPEGRMKRKNGLDLQGNKMTVKAGIADVLATVNTGQMIFAYSGGLHHVQVPGEGFPKVFKKLKMNLEVFEIPDYKAMFEDEPGTRNWRKLVTADIQNRLETKPPKFES